jgi:hypothetical protein
MHVLHSEISFVSLQIAVHNYWRNDAWEWLVGQRRSHRQWRTQMKIELGTSILSLPRDGLIALRDAQGTRVTCVGGALWITEDHRDSDVILEAGEAFTIDRSGLTLVMALHPASLRLSEHRESRAARFAGWFSRLRPASGQVAVC